MMNGRGEQVDEVLPGYSAEVIGLSGVPTAGDVINVVEDEKAAKEIAEHRALKERQAESGKTVKRDAGARCSTRCRRASQKELKIVLKADVAGLARGGRPGGGEALRPARSRSTIIHKGVGMMTETDVSTRRRSRRWWSGFNSKPESGAEAAAKVLEVELVTYSIIYELLDGVKLTMEDLLEPIRTEKKLGRAEVRNALQRAEAGHHRRLVGARRHHQAHARTCGCGARTSRSTPGKIASLKRFKDDVREVAQGFECGIGIEGFTDLKPGDIIEAYEIEETRPSLN